VASMPAAGNHDLPKGASTMPDEDLERVLSAIQAIEKFAGRLPEGDVEGHIRRSAHERSTRSLARTGPAARLHEGRARRAAVDAVTS